MPTATTNSGSWNDESQGYPALRYQKKNLLWRKKGKISTGR
jgi:hypothetical protein